MVFVGVATYIIPKEVFFTIMNASAFSFPQVKLVVLLDNRNTVARLLATVLFFKFSLCVLFIKAEIKCRNKFFKKDIGFRK